jgi:hypothetical protein
MAMCLQCQRPRQEHCPACGSCRFYPWGEDRVSECWDCGRMTDPLGQLAHRLRNPDEAGAEAVRRYGEALERLADS